ncbi:hypothetical protein Cs7R123_02440 [Catellatospora sp. TT07R-123]|nr:hypothetical protein Cs7R123_02440 [Catellatospora sp. TT07R-123]
MILAGTAGCAARPEQSGPGAAPVTATPASAASAAPSPSVSAGSPRPTAAAGGTAVPGPGQAFLLQAVDRIEDPVLTVTASGRIGTYPGGADTGEREQFQLVPLSPGATVYLLKTARLRLGGEPLCAGIQAGVLHTVACDAAATGQRVKLVARGTDASGSATFDLVVGPYDVEVSQDDKVSLKRHGSTPAGTRFRFIPAGTVGQWP